MEYNSSKFIFQLKRYRTNIVYEVHHSLKTSPVCQFHVFMKNFSFSYEQQDGKNNENVLQISTNRSFDLYFQIVAGYMVQSNRLDIDKH